MFMQFKTLFCICLLRLNHFPFMDLLFNLFLSRWYSYIPWWCVFWVVFTCIMVFVPLFFIRWPREVRYRNIHLIYAHIRRLNEMHVCLYVPGQYNYMWSGWCVYRGPDRQRLHLHQSVLHHARRPQTPPQPQLQPSVHLRTAAGYR